MFDNKNGKRGRNHSLIVEQVSDQWLANEQPKPIPLTKQERRRHWLKGILVFCLVLTVLITAVIPILLGVAMMSDSRTAEEGNDAAVGIAVGGGLLVMGLYAAAVECELYFDLKYFFSARVCKTKRKTALTLICMLAVFAAGSRLHVGLLEELFNSRILNDAIVDAVVLLAVCAWLCCRIALLVMKVSERIYGEGEV